MQYHTFGNTGLHVSEVCLGTMTFGDRIDQEGANKAVAFAREQGINFFDTADIYIMGNSGISEKILGEALKPSFKVYAENIVKNAQALANGLQRRGVKLVSGGTDNHLMLVDLTGLELTGKELERRLDEVNITANKNTVPGEQRSPFVTSGVRLGTPAVTTRGLKEEDMDVVAECIAMAMEPDFEEKAGEIRSKVHGICEKYPLYE